MLIGFAPAASTTIPPTRKASTAVMTGTSTPPPRMKPDSREATVTVPPSPIGRGIAHDAAPPTWPPSIAMPSSSSVASGDSSATIRPS